MIMEPRERRTIALAVSVLATALIVVYGVLPFARRWSAREELIAMRTSQIARLRWLAEHESQLQSAAAVRIASVGSVERPRTLSARSPALAASALQTLVQGYADEAGVTVREPNVAGATDSISTSEAIPATVSAISDIYGLSTFLSRLQHGTTLVDIREITIAISEDHSNTRLPTAGSPKIPWKGSTNGWLNP